MGVGAIIISGSAVRIYHFPQNTHTGSLVLALFPAFCDEVLLFLVFTFLVWIFFHYADKQTDCINCVQIHPQYLPEKRGRVSSGYMLASWMESWDKLTLYRGGRGPCVPYRMLPGFCSTIRLEYAHSLDSRTCTYILFILYIQNALSLLALSFWRININHWNCAFVFCVLYMCIYLHQLHGNLIYFPAGVWSLEQHQIEQRH